MLAEKVVEIIESSKSVLEKAGFLQYNSSFPEDANVKDGMIIYIQIAKSFKNKFRKVFAINFIVRMYRENLLIEYDGRLSAETEQNLPFHGHLNNYKITDLVLVAISENFSKFLHIII